MLVGVVIPPPQLNVAPVVAEEAVSISVVAVQVNPVEGAMLAFGGVISWPTVTDAEAVHPFAGAVAVTVYDDGKEMVLDAVTTPPPQINVAPAVADEAESTWLVTVQVKTTGAAMATSGGVTFWVTVTDEVLVHPLVGSVTVTV